MNTVTRYELDSGLSVEVSHASQEAFIRADGVSICLGYLDRQDIRQDARELAGAILEAVLLSEELYPATMRVAS